MKNVLNSPRLLELKKKRRKIFWSKISIYFIIFAVIFVGLAYLSRLPSINIDAVEITGHKVLDGEELKSAVQEELNGRYLWFFPKTNVFIYPESGIRDTLHQKFKRLKEVKFTLKDRKVLQVSVSERAPAYAWCGEEMTETLPESRDETQPCFFMDDSGYIFDEAPYFSGEVYFRFYGSVYSQDASPAGSYFSPGLFPKLVSLKNTLENMKLDPAALAIKGDGEIRVFLSASAKGKMPELILKKDMDFESALGNLQTALETEPLKSNFEKKYSSLEYIDLRFGNRVYYKFK